MLPISQNFRAMLRTNNRRYPQLATHDGRMTGTAATVRHDRRGFLHDRFPIWISFISDQDISILKLVHVLNALDHPHRAVPDLFAHASAGGQQGTVTQDVQISFLLTGQACVG